MNWWIEGMGLFAGALAAASYVPQIRKLWRERDATGISTRMYLVLAAALALWIVYGLVNGAIALVIANAMSLALALTVLAQKHWFCRKPGSDPATSVPERAS